jgi:hypothetical protein
MLFPKYRRSGFCVVIDPKRIDEVNPFLKYVIPKISAEPFLCCHGPQKDRRSQSLFKICYSQNIGGAVFVLSRTPKGPKISAEPFLCCHGPQKDRRSQSLFKICYSQNIGGAVFALYGPVPDLRSQSRKIELIIKQYCICFKNSVLGITFATSFVSQQRSKKATVITIAYESPCSACFSFNSIETACMNSF